MGVERTTVVLEGKDEIYQTEIFRPIIQTIESLAKKKYTGEDKKPMRIIADHLRAATFLLGDGVEPSNKDRGYVLRRLIRRATRYAKSLGINQVFTAEVAKVVVENYQKDYPHLAEKKSAIFEELAGEEERFQETLNRGIKELERIVAGAKGILPGEKAFDLYETYGFPFELAEELAHEKGLSVDKIGFEKAQKEHQEKSRASLKKKFAGGLADHSKTVTKLHTATHLLHAALREVLGDHVHQVGSNITPERLRFDFTHPAALTPEQIKKVEGLINEKIKANLPVKMEMVSLAEAKKQKALAFFSEKYGDQVKVYSIGNFSKEVCGGPHVVWTGGIGGFKIVKEQAIGAGRRRIYAQLAHGS
jgi:alanyl-tRNA synthetase